MNLMYFLFFSFDISTCPSEMDPIFLNLGLQQSSTPLVPTPVSMAAGSSPTINQINGIPQESKLATYISVSILRKRLIKLFKILLRLSI